MALATKIVGHAFSNDTNHRLAFIRLGPVEDTPEMSTSTRAVRTTVLQSRVSATMMKLFVRHL